MRYEASKHSRIKSRFHGITCFEKTLWYNETKNIWEERMKGKDMYSSHQDCNSVRAFRRKLKNCPAGVEFVLLSRWKNHDVYGIGTINMSNNIP